MRIRHAVIGTMFFLMLRLWTAAAAEAETADGESKFKGEIVIGATFPLTGKLETYGQSAYYGANTRVKMINDRGGVNGKKLVLKWRDNRGDPEQAARDFRELAEECNAPAILGPLMSEGTMAARNVAEELGVVLLSPLATIDQATRDHEWVIRVCFTNSAEARGLAIFQMNSYGATSCGILHDPQYASSIELASLFEEMFTQRGGRVVGNLSMAGADGKRDYATPLRELAAHKPDFIFAPCYALEAIELVQAAKEENIAIRLCGSDAWDNQLVFDASGTRLIGTAFASSLFEQGFSYRPFQVFFKAMEQSGMDNPDAQAACAYDAVTLLAHALGRGETPEAIREGLLSVKNMPLATGRTTVSPDGDAVKPVLIRVVERRPRGLVPVYAERYEP